MAGGNQLAIYNRGQGFELGTTKNKSSKCSLVPSHPRRSVKLVGKIRPGRYRARFQASSGHSDNANRPGYEAAVSGQSGTRTQDHQIVSPVC